MKKILWGLVPVLIVAGLFFYEYNKKVLAYQINDDKQAVTKALKDQGPPQDLSVKKMIRLGDSSSYVALFTARGGTLGYARLLKGWNGQFKIGYPMGYGDEPYQTQIFQTNKGKYVTITGVNPGHEIDHIHIRFLESLHSVAYETTYKIHPQKNFYVRFSKIPDHIDKNVVVDMQLFDSQNKKITDEVLKRFE